MRKCSVNKGIEKKEIIVLVTKRGKRPLEMFAEMRHLNVKIYAQLEGTEDRTTERLRTSEPQSLVSEK